MIEKMTELKKHPIKLALCLAACVLCVLYGFAIRAVGAGTGFYKVWFGLGFCFLLLGAAFYFNLPERMPKVLLWLIRGAVLLFLAVMFFVEALIGCHFGDAGEQGLEYIIVLGAQMKESGPSVVLKYRLDKAAEYLKANPDTVCIVTGAQGSNEPCTEADGMAAYLVECGIAEERIIKEPEAENTVENIRFSSAFFDKETATVGIVTNNFHLFRALHIAKKQGLKHVCGIAADAIIFYLPNNCLREFLGIIKDFAVGNMA